jgi:hypothetical protein
MRNARPNLRRTAIVATTESTGAERPPDLGIGSVPSILSVLSPVPD